MQSVFPYPRGSLLADDVAARLLGLNRLGVGRHESDSLGTEFWVQSVWWARVVPTFHADAYLVGVTVAEPWQPAADSRSGVLRQLGRLLRGRIGPRPPVVDWRRVLVSLQGATAVIELDADPVPAALRAFDLFDPFELASMDGVGYAVEFETWLTRGRVEFGNPAVPSHRRLEAALLAVARIVAASPGGAEVADYLSIWSRYATR